MSEPEPPTLPELHEMVIGLARDNSILKKQLSQTRSELKALKAELADLGKAFKFEVTNVTKHFGHDRDELKRIYDMLGDIHEQLSPLFLKVFPGSAKTRQQIAAILRTGRRNLDDKRN